MSRYLGTLVNRLQAGRTASEGRELHGRAAGRAPALAASITPAPLDDPFEALAGPGTGQEGDVQVAGRPAGVQGEGSPARHAESVSTPSPPGAERVLRRSLPPGERTVRPEPQMRPSRSRLSSEAGPVTETTRRLSLGQASGARRDPGRELGRQEQPVQPSSPSQPVPPTPPAPTPVRLQPADEQGTLFEALRALRTASQAIARANAGSAEEASPDRGPATRTTTVRAVLPLSAAARPFPSRQPANVVSAQPAVRAAAERALPSRGAGRRPLVSIGKLSVEVVPAASSAPAVAVRPAARPAPASSARSAPPSRLRFGLEQM